jgi:hypothetical protein
VSWHQTVITGGANFLSYSAYSLNPYSLFVVPNAIAVPKVHPRPPSCPAGRSIRLDTP